MERADLSRLLGAAHMTDEPRDSVVSVREPQDFMTAFRDAVAAGGTVFLADPSWSNAERMQFDSLCAMRVECSGAPCAETPNGAHGWLCVPTGGSSGNLKLARHDENTIAAAVAGFCAYFGVARVNSVGLLPLHHVSGLMAWMRTVLTGGTYVPASWKAVEAGDFPSLPTGEGGWFLSLVPTQMQRLLGNPKAEEWLRRFRAVFVGGGPAWPELIHAGMKARLPLSFSYGMTETAAMVTALRPEEFLSGARGVGSVLPHAQIEVNDEGCIVIGGASLFRGYWPETRSERVWITEDAGHFDECGNLQVTGRRDALIITGGEKVNPSEVEAVLRSTGQFSDVAVIGLPDTQWGEIVAACYPTECAPRDLDAVRKVLAAELAGFKHPKRYVAIARWPVNAQGKINRAGLKTAASG